MKERGTEVGHDLRSVSFLRKAGAHFNLLHLSKSPRTASDVSLLYRCPVRAVLKSIVLKGKNNNVLVVLPGDRRIDMQKLHVVVGKDIFRTATPDEVRSISGYTIGSVSPFATKEDLRKIMDKSVFELDEVNMGSGDARIGIVMKSHELKQVWDGIVADVIAVQ